MGARPRQSLSKASVGHHIPKGLKAKLQKDKSVLDFPTVDTKTDSPKSDEMEIKTSEVIPPNAFTLILTSGKQHCRQCFVSHTPCRKFCKHPKQFGINIDLQKTFNCGDNKKIDTCNLKLCGGGRPKKIKAPKLRILAPGSNLGNMVATIFRSLNKYWFQYDYHTRCKYTEKTACTFCALRSLSQRLSQAKHEKHIEPYELVRLKFDLTDNINFEAVIQNTLFLMFHKFQLLNEHAPEFNLLKINCANGADFSSLIEIAVAGAGAKPSPFLFVLFSELTDLKLELEYIINGQTYAYASQHH